MARAVDRLKGENTKLVDSSNLVAFFRLANSLKRVLPNLLTPLVTIKDGSWSVKFFLIVFVP